MFDRKHILILAAILMTVLIQRSEAQEFTARLDTHAIRIGEQTGLHLLLELPPDARIVRYPSVYDTLGSGIEVISANVPDTSYTAEGNLLLSATVIITSFDSGYHVIRPLRVIYTQGRDTTLKEVQTLADFIGVQSVDVDLQADIKDIKGLMESPLTLREILRWALILAGIILLALAIMYYLRRRKKKEPIRLIPRKPALPPHQVALDALEALKTKKLWQQGMVKEFYSELTEIVRAYIEGRFLVPSLELTSDETLEALRGKTDREVESMLRELLVLADLVKFAKAQPLPDEHDRCYVTAGEFVRKTMISGHGDLRAPADTDPDSRENGWETKQSKNNTP